MSKNNKNRMENNLNYQGKTSSKMNLIEPEILLLLKNNPSHGYELFKRLSDMENDINDPGTLYRNLRSMEEKGLIKSAWSTEKSGPAKRVYQVTNIASEEIEEWKEEIKRRITLLDDLLKKVDQLV
ncbi:MAG: helix-turn-helix transcriptional regulator [Firmicutes bacterium]|nr:helix-turn-helix transcriptional regulator [Bacillota bacterium]